MRHSGDNRVVSQLEFWISQIEPSPESWRIQPTEGLLPSDFVVGDPSLRLNSGSPVGMTPLGNLALRK